MEIMFPQKDSNPAGRFPLFQVLPGSEYYQPVRLPTDHQAILACHTCLALQAPPESAGSPLFPQKPLAACRRCEPRSDTLFSPSCEQGISAFLIEGQSRPLHNTIDFGATSPLHLSIPAYCLPVYASHVLFDATYFPSVDSVMRPRNVLYAPAQVPVAT